MKKYLLRFLCVLLLLAAASVVLLKQPILLTPDVPAAPFADPAELEKHVRMLSENFYPRSQDRPETLEAAASYIHNQFRAAGGRVEDQWFPVEDRKFRNIVAAYGPEEGPAIIVGAHYDSFGDTQREGALRQTHTPGADDNASGVAGLLALARMLQERPPQKRVLLVAWCLEEPPFFGTEHMGSAFHARAAADERLPVLGILCLEMIGFFSDEENSQTFPAGIMKLFYPTTGNFISIVGRLQDMSLTRTVKGAMQAAAGLPVRSINAVAAIPGVDFSDHRNYWREGISAVMITDTAFYRNFAYHTAEDTADRLDYERMGRVVRGVYAAVAALAGE